MLFLFFLKIIIKFQEKFFLVWVILEIYSLLFIYLLFCDKNIFGMGYSFVYFGIVQLFSRIGFLTFYLLDLTFVSLLFLLSKMGRFPMIEWVIFFVKKKRLNKKWLFFSLKKIIPLYIIREFLNLSFFSVLIIFVLNFFLGVGGGFLAFSLLKLVSWSSIRRTSFFLLVGIVSSKIFFWLISLLLYRLLLFLVFNKLTKVNFSLFILICLLFGVPPFSMFIFKFFLIFCFLNIFSLFLKYFFILFFFFFGFAYFVFFIRERKKLFFGFFYIKSLKICFLFLAALVFLIF